MAELPLYLVIPAGGKGLRMGGDTPKQFRPWGDRPLLRATIEAFFGPGMPRLTGVALAVPPDRVGEVAAWPLPVPAFVAEGGETRQDSVEAALALLPGPEEALVLIHDGVRPFPPPGPIRAALEALSEADGAVLAEASTDTLKRVDAEGYIEATEPRDRIFRAQTPQAARLGNWRRAFAAARKAGYQATDDVALLEALGMRVRVIPSPGSNVKLTTPEDWVRWAPRPVAGSPTD